MITTNTGAKKLESSDNWREIFPNPGTGTAGAHNATVDAQDRIQAEVAPIINGKRCSLGAASGEYVLLRNSTIAGKTDGAYKATKAIPANTDLDSTYLGSPITGGMVNELNSNMPKYVYASVISPSISVGGDATEVGLPTPPETVGKTILAIIPVCATPQSVNSAQANIVYYDRLNQKVSIWAIGSGTQQYAIWYWVIYRD